MLFLNTALQGITDEGFVSGMTVLAAALAMWPGFSIAYGQGRIGAEAMAAIGRQPEAKGDILQSMIVGMGITETAAIYGMVVAFVIIFFS